ncbi:MAG: hypothetical protein JW807_07370 [Spirochaetes bacterium]|nr:hypothetical protein [Spirochaetota bacterium]
MLSKKTTTSSSSPKAAPPKSGKKVKHAATFDVSRFQDEIKLQAYYNYLKRVNNNFPGSEMGDWLEAEKSVMLKMKAH